MSYPDPDPPDSDEALTWLLRGNARGIPAPGMTTTWDFVWRWPEDYRADRVWPVVSRLLVDGDVDVRAHALEFVRGWHEGSAVMRPRLLEVAEQHPELFVQSDETGTTLRSQLGSTLANLFRYAEGVRERDAERIWKIVADEPMDSGSATILAEYAPERMIEHMRRWGARAAPAASAAAFVFAAFRRDELVGFLGELRVLSEDQRREILQVVEGAIIRDETKAALMGKGLGLPAPARPAPTVDEVRAALGL